MTTQTTKVQEIEDHGGLPITNFAIQSVAALPATTYARIVYLTTIDGANPADRYYEYIIGTGWTQVGMGSGSVDDTAYNATSWDGVTTVAPSKNAVRDKIVSIDAAIASTVDDTAYNAGTWDAVTTVAPSKNAVRDKIEALNTAKADLASPTFTGTPAAPTASATTNTTQIATTAMVQAAITAYVQASDVAAFKGATDLSSNPNFPSAQAGEFYRVSVAGKIGGASGVQLEVGDIYMAVLDNAGGTQASVGTSWIELQTNIDGAVVGPVSSTAGNIPTFSGTTGKVIQDSAVALSALATLASPVFTGNPQAPTATAGDNDTSVATTAFVQTAISGKKYAATIGDGSTEDIAVTHSLGTTDIQVEFMTVSDGSVRRVPWKATSSSVVTAYFPTGQPPASNEVRIVVSAA